MASRVVLEARPSVPPPPPDPRFADINPRFAAHPRAVDAYRLVGRFISKAMFDRQLVDMPFSRALVMRLLGKSPVGLDDLRESDEQLVTGLTWVLNNDITGVLDSTFTSPKLKPVSDATVRGVLGHGVDDDDDDEEDEDVTSPSAAGAGGASGGASGGDSGGGGGNGDGDGDEDGMGALVEEEEVDLVPGGSEKEVTNDNKKEYVQLMVDWRTQGCFAACLTAMQEGLFEVSGARGVGCMCVCVCLCVLVWCVTGELVRASLTCDSCMLLFCFLL